MNAKVQEFEIRRNGLRALDRKNLVANFEAYWPGKNSKGVRAERLICAIMLAETHPEDALSTVGIGVKGTENW